MCSAIQFRSREDIEAQNFLDWPTVDHQQYHWQVCAYLDELVQERHNSIANAMELRLFCTNPSICAWKWPHDSMLCLQGHDACLLHGPIWVCHYGPSQGEEALPCNAFSHWPNSYTEFLGMGSANEKTRYKNDPCWCAVEQNWMNEWIFISQKFTHLYIISRS